MIRRPLDKLRRLAIHVAEFTESLDQDTPEPRWRVRSTLWRPVSPQKPDLGLARQILLRPHRDGPCCCTAHKANKFTSPHAGPKFRRRYLIGLNERLIGRKLVIEDLFRTAQPMSLMGQSRHFGRVPVTSGVRPIPDMALLCNN